MKLSSMVKNMSLGGVIAGLVCIAPNSIAQSMYATNFATEKSTIGWNPAEEESGTPWTHVTGNGKSLMCSPTDEYPMYANFLIRTMDVVNSNPTSLTLSTRGYVFQDDRIADAPHLGVSLQSFSDENGDDLGSMAYVTCDPTFCKARLFTSLGSSTLFLYPPQQLDLTENTLISATFSPASDPTYTQVTVKVNNTSIGTRTFSNPGTVGDLLNGAASFELLYHGMYSADTDGDGELDTYAYGDTCVDSIGYQMQ